MRVGLRIKQLRKREGLSLRALARKAGIGHVSLFDIEKRKDPRTSTLKALAGVFDVSMDWLAGRTDKREVNR